MTAYILPALIAVLLIYSVFKRVSVYDCFVEGSKEAAKTAAGVFPYISAIFICIQLFRASGLSAIVVGLLSKPLSLLGIPPELAELLILRPLSGSGSLAVLEGIFDEYGVDSFISKCAAVIMGSTETIFYVAAVYLSGCHVKKTRGALPIALVAGFIGSVAACLLCRLI